MTIHDQQPDQPDEIDLPPPPRKKSLDERIGDYNEFFFGERDLIHTQRYGWISPRDPRIG